MVQRAFHSPADRQGYLRSLIEDRFVSQANLRLAHLLLSKRMANLVVTTNFDDFISRSLTIFGEAHVVCDHPETIQRIAPRAMTCRLSTFTERIGSMTAVTSWVKSSHGLSER